MKFCFNPSFAKLYFKNLFPYSTLFFPQGTHHKYRGSFCYNLNHIAFVKHIKHINPRKTQKIKKPKSKIIQHIKYIFQKGTSNISAHALITSCCCFFFSRGIYSHWFTSTFVPSGACKTILHSVFSFQEVTIVLFGLVLP